MIKLYWRLNTNIATVHVLVAQFVLNAADAQRSSLLQADILQR